MRGRPAKILRAALIGMLLAATQGCASPLPPPPPPTLPAFLETPLAAFTPVATELAPSPVLTPTASPAPSAEPSAVPSATSTPVIDYVATAVAALATVQSRPVATATPSRAPTPSPVAPGVTDLTQLRQFMLELINKDRADFGLPAVRLGTNTAAQKHAEDMLAKYYLGHIDSGGMKPYMRYSLAGGLGTMGENAGYAGTMNPQDTTRYERLDPRQWLQKLEYGMMYDDAGSDWGHREQILRPHHQAVSIGIAFTESRLALAQHFEATPISFSKPPGLSGTTLSLAGTAGQSLGPLNHIAIYFDPAPLAYGRDQLLAQPHSYSVGSSDEPLVRVLPPPPPGYNYTDLGPTDIVAKGWKTAGNTFDITADLGPTVSKPGVYTVVVLAEVAQYPLTTISLFVP